MSKRRVVLIAAGLSVLYFVIQLAYISRLPLVMDEFDGANEAYQLFDLTPYQDFRPYKTVVGYYLQVPPLMLTSDPWTGVIYSKVWLALINTAAIFAATLSLATVFSPASALLGQLLWISMTTFLERSSEIRVDMLTAWFGLASLLLLLKRQWLVAGIVAGLSFLVSQKGVYYVLSANVAAGAFWLFASRDRRTFRDLVLLNGGAVAVIAVYILLWGLVSSPWAVFSVVFLSHRDIILGGTYDLEVHWQRTLTKNPFFYVGAVIGLTVLLVAWWRDRVGGVHAMAAVYAGVLFALCRWHKQPWPYFFVLLVPTLMVVHVAVADFVSLRLAKWRTPAVALVLLLGVAWPFSYMPGILANDHDYQRHVVRLADAMLDEGDTYLAGNDLVFTGRQSLASLRRLGAPHLEAMQLWPQERFDALIADIEAARPKLIISDYRMRRLPDRLQKYFATRFDPLWSSVNGYAPVIGPDERDFDLWFDGEYRVEPTSGDVVIDGNGAAPGSMHVLRKGRHRIDSTGLVRLRLQPRGFAALADPAMQRRQAMFGRVYNY